VGAGATFWQRKKVTSSQKKSRVHRARCLGGGNKGNTLPITLYPDSATGRGDYREEEKGLEKKKISHLIHLIKKGNERPKSGVSVALV